MPINRADYGPRWKEITAAMIGAIGCCERCGDPGDGARGPLSSHHLDGQSLWHAPYNLAVLCSTCHLDFHRGKRPGWSIRETAQTSLWPGNDGWWLTRQRHYFTQQPHADAWAVLIERPAWEWLCEITEQPQNARANEFLAVFFIDGNPRNLAPENLAMLSAPLAIEIAAMRAANPKAWNPAKPATRPLFSSAEEPISNWWFRRGEEYRKGARA